MKLKSFAASALAVLLTAQMTLAEGLSNNDMSFAFGKQDATAQKQQAIGPVALNRVEMDTTEGEALPLFAIGALHAGRFIATRYVSRNVAASALRSGCSVMCSGTSAQARSLATQAYGRGNVLRHGPSGHARSPVNYSHYQAANGSTRSHVFYGPRLR